MQYANKMTLGYKHSKPGIHIMTPILIQQTFASEPSVRYILSVVPKHASGIRKYLQLGDFLFKHLSQNKVLLPG